MRYQAIIFDVGDTLLQYRPSWAETFGGKLRALGFETSQETIWAVSNAVYWAHEEKTGQDEAALSCVPCPEERREECLRKKPAAEVISPDRFFLILAVIGYRLTSLVSASISR
ncbi:MAG: hypothetical protein FWC62_07360 [Firmicutes bacterium]|nr:hypothetical protein [Bacillota bacterium]